MYTYLIYNYTECYTRNVQDIVKQKGTENLF